MNKSQLYGVNSHFKACSQGVIPTAIFTGRNEVLAKVIFSQACVCPQGGGAPDFALIFRGGGLFFGGVPPNFQGGCVFLGGVPPTFSGGGFLQISRGGLHRNTVNVWPVRILLECILVVITSNGLKIQSK